MSVSYNVLTPSNLSDIDLNRVYNLEQDMWARSEWLWEYLQCWSCESMFSKQDIYDKRDTELYRLTVAEIEALSSNKISCCPDCWWELRHRFPRESYIDEMKKRYSGKAHMVLMKCENQIVWFMDGHISDYDTVFNRDFAYRYSQINKEQISWAIRDILWEVPDLMFSCSSMWTTETYMSFQNIYLLLQAFFVNFPSQYEWYTGVSELDMGGSLEKIYTKLGAKMIDMADITDINSSDSYTSGIYVQERLWEVYKNWFSKDLRTFLRERAI